VLIGEVAFRNWTPDNRLRHPSWRGLRTDRSPASVRRVPEPIPPPAQGTVTGAMQTTDRQWRVEAVRRDGRDFFRLIHGDNIIDGLVTASLQRLLTEAGIDMADLMEADTTPMPGAAGAA
jgi:bifunctional non-homologous end joining protein LigD